MVEKATKSCLETTNTVHSSPDSGGIYLQQQQQQPSNSMYGARNVHNCVETKSWVLKPCFFKNIVGKSAFCLRTVSKQWLSNKHCFKTVLKVIVNNFFFQNSAIKQFYPINCVCLCNLRFLRRVFWLWEHYFKNMFTLTTLSKLVIWYVLYLTISWRSHRHKLSLLGYCVNLVKVPFILEGHLQNYCL